MWVQFGFHVQLYSKTELVFGEEEAVMPQLEKVSSWRTVKASYSIHHLTQF